MPPLDYAALVDIERIENAATRHHNLATISPWRECQTGIDGTQPTTWVPAISDTRCQIIGTFGGYNDPADRDAAIFARNNLRMLAALAAEARLARMLDLGGPDAATARKWLNDARALVDELGAQQ